MWERRRTRKKSVGEFGQRGSPDGRWNQTISRNLIRVQRTGTGCCATANLAYEKSETTAASREAYGQRGQTIGASLGEKIRQLSIPGLSRHRREKQEILWTSGVPGEARQQRDNFRELQRKFAKREREAKIALHVPIATNDEGDRSVDERQRVLDVGLLRRLVDGQRVRVGTSRRPRGIVDGRRKRNSR